MKPFTPHTTRAVAIGASAVAICLTGGAFAAAQGSWSGYGNGNGSGSGHGGGRHNAHQVTSSGGEGFLRAGQTVRLGRAGHFTFTASCTTDDTGGNVATFDVTADTTAALDGNAPVEAGTKVNIHTNSDALDGKDPGEFDQVASASDSTLIAADGREVDVIYNDGVNWPAMGGSLAHDCFAGYTGIIG
jgi:hypothetical protein